MIRTIVLGIILLFLQIFKSSSLAIGIAMPNFLIAYAIFLGWAIEEKWAYLLIFLTGLGYDLMMPQTLGMNALLLLLICWITMLFHNSVLEPRLPVMSLLTLIANIVFYFFFGIYYFIQKPEFLVFLGRFLLTAGYNSLISLILYYLLMLLYKLRVNYN
ncbi:MAG: rod shape-determining protein MreD [Candidatus Cloacimonetes bacterium]|nr:rod shape-determining protein MreD [Candidatus Cloacimonadota bacterium]